MISQAQWERFGRRVHEVRKYVRGLTLDEVVAARGPSRGTMVDLEKGRMSSPPANFVFTKLEIALGLKKDSARKSLVNDTDLVLKDAPRAKPEAKPTYTEDEVTRLRKFVAALERSGVAVDDVGIHKSSEGGGFVLSQELIDQITGQLNSLPAPGGQD